MVDHGKLAVETCERLTLAQLRAICRARGWSPLGSGKEALVAFVAPRLLEPTGAAAAMAALDEHWLRVLHGIAMEHQPPDIDVLASLACVGAPALRENPRALFRAVADGLLVAGVVLVEERGITVRDGRTFPDLVFHLPDAHRAALPAYPVETVPLGAESRRGDPAAFFRAALIEAIGSASPSPPEGLAHRVASALTVADGPIRVGTAEVLDLAGFLDQARRIWTGALASKKARRARRAALYVLRHLPAGRGVPAEGLRAAIAPLGHALSSGDAAAFLGDGCAAGFVVRGGTAGQPCFRAAEEPPAGGGGEEVVLRAALGGVLADVERSAPDALLALASVSSSKKAPGGIAFVPHPVFLGRRADRLATLPGLGAARAVSPAFEAAAARTEQRCGKLVLHRGLLVARVEDEGLAAVLAARLGEGVRALSAVHLAFPAALAGRVEEVVRREGFALRRTT